MARIEYNPANFNPAWNLAHPSVSYSQSYYSPNTTPHQNLNDWLDAHFAGSGLFHADGSFVGNFEKLSDRKAAYDAILNSGKQSYEIQVDLAELDKKSFFASYIWGYEYNIEPWLLGLNPDDQDTRRMLNSRGMYGGVKGVLINQRFSDDSYLSDYGNIYNYEPFTQLRINLSDIPTELPSSSSKFSKQKRYLYVLLISPDNGTFNFSVTKNWTKVVNGMYVTTDSQATLQYVDFDFPNPITKFSAKLFCITSTKDDSLLLPDPWNPDTESYRDYLARIQFNFSRKTGTGNSTFSIANNPGTEYEASTLNYETLVEPIEAPDLFVFDYMTDPLSHIESVNPKPRYGLARVTLSGFDPSKPIMCFGDIINNGNLANYHLPMHQAYIQWNQNQIDFWTLYNFLQVDKASPKTWVTWSPDPTVWGGASATYSGYYDDTGYPSYDDYFVPSLIDNPRYDPDHVPNLVDVETKLYPYHRYELVDWNMGPIDLNFDPLNQNYSNDPFPPTSNNSLTWKRDASYSNYRRRYFDGYGSDSDYLGDYISSPTGSYFYNGGYERTVMNSYTYTVNSMLDDYFGYKPNNPSSEDVQNAINGLAWIEPASFGCTAYGGSTLGGLYGGLPYFDDPPYSSQQNWYDIHSDYYTNYGSWEDYNRWRMDLKFAPRYYNKSLTNNSYIGGYTDNNKFIPVIINNDSSSTSNFVKFYSPDFWLTDAAKSLYKTFNDTESGLFRGPFFNPGETDLIYSTEDPDMPWATRGAGGYYDPSSGILAPGSGSGGIDANGNPYVLFWIYPGQTSLNAKFVQFNYSNIGGGGWKIGTIGV